MITKAHIPASVTEIHCTFYQAADFTDVDYDGTSGQWNLIKRTGAQGFQRTVHYSDDDASSF